MSSHLKKDKFGQRFGQILKVWLKFGQFSCQFSTIVHSLLQAILLALCEEHVIDVVVDLHWTVLPSDDPRRAALEMVAHERLLVVRLWEVLEVAARVVQGARLLAFHLGANEGADEDGVLPRDSYFVSKRIIIDQLCKIAGVYR